MKPTGKSFKLLDCTPEPKDADAFETIKRILESSRDMEDSWVNVFLTRFHCKPLSYYLNKYLN